MAGLEGGAAEGLIELRRAATLVAPEEGAAVLAIVADPLRDFLQITHALPLETTQGIRDAIDLCQIIAIPVPDAPTVQPDHGRKHVF